MVSRLVLDEYSDFEAYAPNRPGTGCRKDQYRQGHTEESWGCHYQDRGRAG